MLQLFADTRLVRHVTPMRRSEKPMLLGGNELIQGSSQGAWCSLF